jgi:hypothetical protein
MPNTLVDILVGQDMLSLDIRIPLQDFATASGIPEPALQSGNTPIDTLRAYVLPHLHFTAPDGRPWTCTLDTWKLLKVQDPLSGSFTEIQLLLRARPPEGAPLRSFVWYYDLVMHQILTHQAIVALRQDWENGIYQPEGQLAVIQVDAASGRVFPLAVQLDAGSTLKGLKAMLLLGMRHIAEGVDHLTFLLLLLVVAPLTGRKGEWAPGPDGRFALRRLLWIVSAFTLGHSLTLAVCSLGWHTFSGALVEVAIAFSILVSAVHAWRPLFYQKELLVAGAFGLIHGMAFSEVLTPLHLPVRQLLWSILGFNLGIECIQLALVAAAAPLLWWFSRQNGYRFVHKTAAILGMAAGMYWLWQRLY